MSGSGSTAEELPDSNPAPARSPDCDSGSMSAHCEERLKWSQSALFPEGHERWVCRNANCENTVCQNFRSYVEAKTTLSEAQEALKRAEAELTQSQEALKRAEAKLTQSQEALKRAEAELTQSQEALKSSQAEVTELQSMNETVLHLLKSAVADKKAAVADKKTILEREKAAVADKKTILQKTCESILEKHDHLKSMLMFAKAAGNKTDHRTMYTGDNRMNVTMKKEDESVKKEVGGVAAAKRDSPSKFAGVMRDAETGHDQRLQLSDDENAMISEFFIFCNQVFLQSQPSRKKYKSAGFVKDIRSTCQLIVDWKPNDSIEPTTETFRPSEVAQEEAAVHPILLALMWKIKSILGGTSHFTHEQRLPEQIEKSRRYMDAMWSSAPQQFLPYADGSLIGKSTEFKPVSRKGVPFSKLVQDGGNQILGHNLQVIWDSCFHFAGGLGRNGSTSGAVLTMISIQIQEAELSHAGTEKVKLEVLRHENQPLFSKETTEVLSHKRSEALDTLGLKFAAATEIQPGFKSLIHFVMSNESSVASTANAVGKYNNVEFGLDEYIGSGAYSSVYTCKSATTIALPNPLVAKIGKSRHFSHRALKNELGALKALQHEAIPRLGHSELVSLRVQQRCEHCTVECVMLQLDRGLPVNMLCKSGRWIGKQVFFAGQVYKSMMNVLDYIHKQKWFHLDINPSNIVFMEEEKKFILIDWGTAAKQGEKLQSYRGTPPFSHPALLAEKNQEMEETTTEPAAKFDSYSLAMTVCYILHGGIPWDGFNGLPVTASRLQARKEKALNLTKNMTRPIKECLSRIINDRQSLGPPSSTGKRKWLS
eukprot:scaffold2533_cov137-Cylindrotheca_fusiformis.AAC.19